MAHTKRFADKVKGFSDISMAIISSKICNIYYLFGHLMSKEQMIDMTEQNIEILNKNHNKYSTHIAQSLFYLGQFYIVIEYYKEAQKSFEASLDIYIKHFPTSYMIPKLWVFLGHNNQKLGHYDRGKQMIIKGRDLYEKLQPQRYDKIAWTIALLGDIERKIGNYLEASTLLEESIRMYLDYYPGLKRQLAWAYGILGKINRARGCYEEAALNLIKSRDIVESAFGSHNSLNAWCEKHLCRVWHSAGNYKESLAALDKSFNLYKKQYQPNNYNYLRSLYFGMIYSSVGNNKQAQELLIDAVSFCNKNLGTLNINSAMPVVYLGQLYTHTANYSEAHKLLNQGLDIYKKHFAETHIKIAWVRSLLGANYMLSGNYTKAKDILGKSLIVHENHYGKDHLETARVIAGIGQNYLMQGEIDLAEPLLNKAHTIFDKAKHPDIYIVLESLSELNLKKTNIIQIQGSNLNTSDQQEVQVLKTQALKYLQNGLAVINKHFPDPDISMNSIRIKAKIKSLTEGMPEII